MLGNEVPEGGGQSVRETKCIKEEGLDLCLEDTLVRDLGFGIDQ